MYNNFAENIRINNTFIEKNYRHALCTLNID